MHWSLTWHFQLDCQIKALVYSHLLNSISLLKEPDEVQVQREVSRTDKWEILLKPKQIKV